MTMDDICRLCMTNTQCDKLKIPLFQEKSPEFIHNLVTLLGFPINVGDGLPSHICVACSEFAIEAHKFKTKCIESNHLLWERLRRENGTVLVKNEQNHDSPYQNNTENDCEMREAENIDTFVKKECEHCNLYFSCDADYIEHARMHGIVKIEFDDTLFSCDVCDYKTNSENDFDTHNRNHQSNNWQCSESDCGTSVESEQPKHRKKHSKENPFQCNACDMKFKRLYHLKQHMTTHSQERPFQCQMCHSSFKILGGLQRHMTTHSEERPYQCEICDSTFKVSGHLKQHMETHSEEKPFQCQVCQSEFKNARGLKRHMLTHSEEKPFQCKMCDQNFRLSSNLKQHMVKHSQDRPFPCEKCHREFKALRSLQRHKLKHLEEETFPRTSTC